MDQPDPLDEARNGIYYLEGLGASTVGDVLEELREQLASVQVRLPSAARLTFGTWIGGDRNGNPSITPATTLDVLQLQAPECCWAGSTIFAASSPCPGASPTPLPSCSRA